MHTSLRRVVAWLRQGYPDAAPATGHQPLLALMRRRLTDDEVAELGEQLLHNGITAADRVTIGAGMTKVTRALPAPDEVARVCERLREMGYPVVAGAEGLR